jgi:F0F1-type ATP synthase assembly protein I
MVENPQNRPDLGYFAMMQIGIEMAAPAALGIWLDTRWGSLPWLTATGAILGLVLGLVEVTRIGSKGGKEKNSDDVGKGQLPGDKQP